ncbi:TetR family transcriptional regulator [Agrococcus sediminis]|uniref:TetR family transcriptional regulator n=1 Tax=Agrococcus sediminis TaxID=2599924 RepID=A0A5M8QJ80_9MICO|nr:TetR family transcriptional regulator [Agrococcus sediminis]KAA6435201.1 TetR family transcriptional regulator [Agrococcus sediminis]
MSTTRDRVVAAAIELLGTEGARGLTHRRVDERAGLPEGSTSNHFRTRAALVEGASDGLVAAEMLGLRAMRVESADDLVEQSAQLIELVTGPLRVATAARHVLFLEAAHDVRLRERISASRAGYVAVVEGALRDLGAPEPERAAEALMAASEGIILHRIARGDASDPRPALAIVVRGALG